MEINFPEQRNSIAGIRSPVTSVGQVQASCINHLLTDPFSLFNKFNLWASALVNFSTNRGELPTKTILKDRFN